MKGEKRPKMIVLNYPATCAFCHHEVLENDLTCYNCWPGLRPKGRPAPTKKED